MVKLNENRILGRLESVLWKIPSSRVGRKDKRPLHVEVQKLSSDISSSPLTDIQPQVTFLADHLARLSVILREVDDCELSPERLRHTLETAIKETHNLCTSGGSSSLEERVSEYGFRPSQAASNRTVRRLDKLGRYWGLCKALAEDSRRYTKLFTKIQMQCPPPFEGKNSDISFIPGQRARCLVHAEMQLLVFYNLRIPRGSRKPRIIGVSKSCCYLCNLFIIKHGQFFITKTHGRLYERWAFPDICDYSPEQRENYRRILSAMDREIVARHGIECRNPRKREHPMESWLAIPPARLLSPVSSTIFSSVSEEVVEYHSKLPPAPSDISPPLTTPRSTTPVFKPSLDELGDSIQTAVPNSLSTSPAISNTGFASPVSSLVSWNYPQEKTITASSLIRAHSEKLSLFLELEIEAPSSGGVRIERILTNEDRELVNVADINAMNPGEERMFSKASLEDPMILNLQHSREQFTRLALRWS